MTSAKSSTAKKEAKPKKAAGENTVVEKSDKPEKLEKIDKPDKPDKVDKPDKADKPEKGKKFLHVRLDGKTKEFALADLSLSNKAADDDIIAVLAKHLRIEVERFSLFRVERTKEGNIFIRPDALFSDQ